MTDAPEKIWAGPSQDDKGVFWDVGHWDADFDKDCIEYTRTDVAQARIAQWRSNSRDTFEAMCAMRDDINNVVPMPSLDSDLLLGPENWIFCNVIAAEVTKKVTDQNARIARLESALRDMVGHAVEFYENGGDDGGVHIEDEPVVISARAALKVAP